MTNSDIPITLIALEIAIAKFKDKYGVPPPNLPAWIIDSNLKNWQTEYVKALEENEGITPEEAGKIAAENISFGTHRKTLFYTKISVLKMGNKKEVVINGIKYQEVPTSVYLTAKKPELC